MKVVSPAGEFEIRITEAGVESDKIVMKGQMGVWDSTIYVRPDEIWRLVTLMLRPSILLYMLKVFLKSFLGTKEDENGG